ncbi:MAG: YlzJ-like family protein [Caldicoprobacterales bacterium]|nr:hypothetical protein [Clostridiales bacterium]
MIIYSIIPIETIFSMDQQKDKDIEKNKIIEFNKIKVEARLIEEDIYEIQRIISTNIHDYLAPWLQPGTRIRLNYQLDEFFPKNRW